MRSAVLDPGRDADRLASSRAARGPGRPQERHGFSITVPVPWQVGQVRSMVKNPCCARTASVTLAGAAGRSATIPASAPLPRHGSHWANVLTADRGLLALERFLERDFEVVAQIAAAAVDAAVAPSSRPSRRTSLRRSSAKTRPGKAEPAGAGAGGRRLARTRHGRNGHRRRASDRPSECRRLR